MGLYTKVYKKIDRPDPSLVERFAKLPVANIDDCLGRLNCISSAIRPFNKTEMCGTACTVKAAYGEGMLFHLALDIAEPGDIIMVDAGGCPERGMCGEGMYRYARQRGIKGFVVDACLRDSEEASTFTDFGIYARGVQSNGQKAANAGYINVPVSIGGIVVFPGDIIRGDQDGVVVIPKAIAAEVIDIVEAFAQKDLKKNAACADGTVDRAWVGKFFEGKNYEFLDEAWHA